MGQLLTPKKNGDFSTATNSSATKPTTNPTSNEYLDQIGKNTNLSTMIRYSLPPHNHMLHSLMD